ncbi:MULTISPECIES: calcium-binding protein [unclassified Nocardioides]|uniref:calcium-binding protein n=1 Tax=unclassified Nocardioides TaxID=2615069 RepID=UPI0036D29A84
MPTLVSRLAALATVAGPLVLLGAPAPAPAAGVPTCFGRAPTIVAAPGEEAVGTDGDDVIVGGSDVYGGNGDDRLCGFTGKAHGQAGEDRIEVVAGASGQGGPGDDLFVTRSAPGSAPAHVYGKAGADVVRGGPGRDFVFTGVGGDTVHGGAGRDSIHLNWGENVAHGGRGADGIIGHVKDDRLYGGRGDDTLYGGGNVDDHDLGDGGRGRDTCGEIERETSCEVAG